MEYQEILDRMNEKFEELAGYLPDRASDAGIRMRLLAGELYSLSTEAERIQQQMFPDTASGAYLDLHAQQRGLSRIEGEKASGLVVFRLDMPAEHDMTIPQGTVCSNADGSLRYVTVEDAVIPRNDTYKMVECIAQHSGTQYNIARNQVKVIVTYFAVGMEITNASSFIGGTDDESDEQLRARILDNCRNVPNGANQAYYARLASSVDGIQSASVNASVPAGGIVVYVGGRGNIPTDEAFQNVSTLLQANCPFGISLSVRKAEAVTVNVTVTVQVRSGYETNAVTGGVGVAIQNFFRDLSVGEDVKLAALGKAIYETDGVENYAFSGMQDVAISQQQLAKCGSVSVSAA